MEAIQPVSNSGTEQSAVLTVAVNNTPATSTSKPFIEANTEAATLQEIRERHLIPTYIDAQPVISQAEFIEVTTEMVQQVFHSEQILAPSIRLSHPVAGRVPEAKNKPVGELTEAEKTIYYQRCMFVIEVPSIRDSIDGQQLSLTIGGVRAHNLDALYNRSGGEEHFKVFIGFQVKVCTNLCVWSDGYAGDLRVRNLLQLRNAIYNLILSYDAISGLKQMTLLQQHSLSEQQFAQLIGRCRMYQHLPTSQKKHIPELKFSDTQITAVCKDYYRDNSFCKGESGDINLWRLYNLFTSANRNTYIDAFLDRAVNATSFISELAQALEQGGSNWFLS